MKTMRRTLATAAFSVALLVPTTALAEEASPPTTSELDENLPGDAPDAVEDNGDDDSNTGLWGLAGLLGLLGLAGLAGRRRDHSGLAEPPRSTTM
jgi:hypothetical protein